jgi:hypothetical protein
VLEFTVIQKLGHDADHFFDFNLASLKQETHILILPNIIPVDLIEENISIISSDSKVKANFDKGTGNINMIVANQPQGVTLDPKLYIFQDRYQSRLLGKVELALKFHDCYRVSMPIFQE